MSCNPSVGGIAKSHLVCEIDALGGEIARNADYTGIQFRILNTRKGPAVRANRVQCDKEAYSSRMKAVCEGTANLEIMPAKAKKILIGERGQAAGVVCADSTEVSARSVVLTCGTFLKGRTFIGTNAQPGGRRGEESADSLADNLALLGFSMARLKTGTPARLHRNSLDYAAMQMQPGFDPPPFLSWEATHGGELFHVEQFGKKLQPWPPGTGQLPCYVTHTTGKTHQIIRDNLSRSALYGGAVTGTGVRYCPSVEDKVVKFPGRDQHHVFVEPEGRSTALVYPNGISNSLPEDVQVALVRSIPGLNSAKILEYAYAIEYDFVDPTQLTDSLETGLVENLFFAGQINGTTGYEEAAAQGFVAGVNAARKVAGKAAIVVRRHEGYIGVLIDDLITKGTDEPYRMFTSRAEHRLLLRQDNAVYRMLSLAKEIGLLPHSYLCEIERREEAVREEIERLKQTRRGDKNLAQILSRPEMNYEKLQEKDFSLPADVREQVEISVKYEGYVERELRLAQRSIEMDRQPIPSSIDLGSIKQLRTEAREKLSKVKPQTLGQASRVPGISPADIAVISVLLQSQKVNE
jgi:tRNA uridine 5-carboxymethylaminomethyl modification enzyme